MKDINATIMIDLSKREDEIFESLCKDAREGIKKAKKKGLVFKKADNEQEWKEFYEIYKETVKRGGIKLRDYEEFKETGHHLFLCLFNKKIIAGMSIREGDFFGKENARMWFNSSMREFQKLYPNNLLYWEVIRWCKYKGFEKFNLGGWQIKAKGRSVGVNKFKENWGEVEYYEEDYPFFKAIGRKAIRNFPVLRKIADKLRGRV